MEETKFVWKDDSQDLKIISPEEKVFLKILLKNIDPNTGEILTMCDKTIDMLKNVLNKINNIRVMPTKNNGWPNETNQISIDYVNGMTLNELSEKYGLEIKSIKKRLKEQGVAPKLVYIRNTYARTLQLIEKNKDADRVGSRYTPEEDQALVDEYISGMHVKDIAKAHRRKVGGIKSRLVRIGFADKRSELPNIYVGHK